jgi:pyruvate/2-oxoglutarate dehydrogenase complex dihydrolipoamide acyltransferase (E2) component
MEYKWVGNHPQDLADGRWLAPGDTTELSDEDLSDPHNDALLKLGALIPTGEDSVPDATEPAMELAGEHGVPLTAITGTGSGGRIIKEDIERYLADESAKQQEGR